ncbi:hypothetical protein GCM10022295_90950 [Streptomyces osmaniensis]|uniref:Uncharacterized protein n=1 Tax=Streptomyces osmaniensis TaxID=593134 RepID=A0ABP6Z2R4_9ACTN
MEQGLDPPVGADEFGELGRGGLLGGEAGDGVDRLDGGLAGLAVGAPALDLDSPAGRVSFPRCSGGVGQLGLMGVQVRSFGCCLFGVVLLLVLYGAEVAEPFLMLSIEARWIMASELAVSVS